eukprot:TRINITY_DN4156_c0_g1_i1.p1 TRINITY_DN4156_c0_g1~~TRINITY_DN4156_c0_g1_i1.p1  ORF type:complete len:718 (+),score=157.34 TRINITY_DN4156_c0_g1_i1:120-2273(+)
MSSLKKKPLETKAQDIRSFFSPSPKKQEVINTTPNTTTNDNPTNTNANANTNSITSIPAPAPIVSTPPSNVNQTSTTRTHTESKFSVLTTPPGTPLIQSPIKSTNTTNESEQCETKDNNPIPNSNEDDNENNDNNNTVDAQTTNNDLQEEHSDDINMNTDDHNDNLYAPLAKGDIPSPPSSYLRRSSRITHKKEEEKPKRPLDHDDDDLLSSNPLSFSASVVHAKPKRLKYSLDKLLEEKVSGLYDEMEKWTSLEEGETSTPKGESEESKITMEKMNQLVSFRDELAESEEVETIFTQSPVSSPFSLIFPDPIPEKHQRVVSKIQEMTRNIRAGRELIPIFDIIGAFVNKERADPVVSIFVQWVVDAMISIRDLEDLCTSVAVVDRGVRIFEDYISQSGKKFAGVFQFPSPVLSLNISISSDNHNNNNDDNTTPSWIPTFDFFVSLFTRFGVSIHVIESIRNRTEFVESTIPVLISTSTSSSQFPSYNFQGILHILQQSITAFPTSFSPHQYTSLIALISKIMIDPNVKTLSSHLTSLLATLITNYHNIRISSWKEDSYDLCEHLYSSCSYNLSKLKFVKNIPIVNDICYSFKRRFAVYTAARLLEMEVTEDLIRDNLSMSTINKVLKEFNIFGDYRGIVVASCLDIAFGCDKSMIKYRSEIKDMQTELRSVNNRIREVGGYDLIKTKLKDIVILLIGKASIIESECNFSSQRTLFD